MNQFSGRRQSEFNINVNDEGSVFCTGPEEFDGAVAPAMYDSLQETLQRADVSGVVIDLGRTTFLDSSGILTLIRSQQDAAAAEKTFSVRDVHNMPLKVLEMVGLVEILNIETRER